LRENVTPMLRVVLERVNEVDQHWHPALIAGVRILECTNVLDGKPSRANVLC
jgi:hypothetical protein